MNSASALGERLASFVAQEKFRTQGPLAAALVITQRAKRSGLPMNPESLLTAGGGQVAGLGGDAAQKILAQHGVTRRLPKEGGRTSRGMIKKVQAYVALLNDCTQRGLRILTRLKHFGLTGCKPSLRENLFGYELMPQVVSALPSAT